MRVNLNDDISWGHHLATWVSEQIQYKEDDWGPPGRDGIEYRIGRMEDAFGKLISILIDKKMLDVDDLKQITGCRATIELTKE